MSAPHPATCRAVRPDKCTDRDWPPIVHALSVAETRTGILTHAIRGKWNYSGENRSVCGRPMDSRMYRTDDYSVAPLHVTCTNCRALLLGADELEQCSECGRNITGHSSTLWLDNDSEYRIPGHHVHGPKDWTP